MENEKTALSYLFSPFRYFAGGKALAGGIVIILLLSVLGWLSNTYFDGVLDTHTGSTTSPYLVHLYFQTCNWLVVSILFYVVIRFIIKNQVRPIDILGTVAFSHLPLIIICAWGFTFSAHVLDGFTDQGTINLEELSSIMNTYVVAITLTLVLTLVPTIWALVLQYNAFSICGNVSGSKAVWIFVAIIFVAEIISKILNYYIVPLLL